MKQLIFHLEKRFFENLSPTSRKFKWFWSKYWIHIWWKKYYQNGNAYLQYEITIDKHVSVAANRVLVDGDAIRLVNIAFAYCIKEGRLSTAGGSGIEHNKNCGQISTTIY